MNDFKLRRHRVEEASFIENKEKEKKNDIEVRLAGGILIPRDSEDNRYVAVQLRFSLGNPEERLYLTLVTISTFEIAGEGREIGLKEDEVKGAVFPVALTELRKTVKKVTEAYGLPVLELPPFEEEIEKES